MKRKVIPSYKYEHSTVKVTGGDDYMSSFSDTNEVLSEIIIHTMGCIYSGDLTFKELVKGFDSDGEGFNIREVLGICRVECKEDSAIYWPEGDPDLIPPDYEKEEYWIAYLDVDPKGTVELKGDELRRLFHEAYQIYVDRGLIKEE